MIRSLCLTLVFACLAGACSLKEAGDQVLVLRAPPDVAAPPSDA